MVPVNVGSTRLVKAVFRDIPVPAVAQAAKMIDRAAVITVNDVPYYSPSLIACMSRVPLEQAIENLERANVPLKEVDLLENTDYDPSRTSPRIARMENALKNAGVKHIEWTLGKDGAADAAQCVHDSGLTDVSVDFNPHIVLAGGFNYEDIAAHEYGHILASRLGYEYTVKGDSQLTIAVNRVIAILSHPAVYRLMEEYGYPTPAKKMFEKLFAFKQREFDGGPNLTELFNEFKENAFMILSVISPAIVSFAEFLSWLPEYRPQIKTYCGEVVFGLVGMHSAIVDLAREDVLTDDMSKRMPRKQHLNLARTMFKEMGLNVIVEPKG